MRSSPLEGRPLRVAVVGISTDPSTCGVRDHAALLAAALGERGIDCSLHWLTRERSSLTASRAEVTGWARRLSQELAAEPPDLVLLHYSVFTYAHRGVPIFVRPTLAALRGLPIVTVLHEYAYPWGRAGLRGLVWAISQRALLLGVVRASAALVVTAEFRARELAAKRWLPSRPTAVAPVFSNLPAAGPGAHAPRGAGEQPVLGLFGYASEGAALALALDALRLLDGRGQALGLRLLGAPGADSSAGREWIAAAAERGIGRRLSFSGKLAAQALSDELAACELLLFADPSGPTSRKTTLAASLASGSPLVAIDGPKRWAALSEAQAARIVAPRADALADALGELLGDAAARAELGFRGADFARREMALAPSAEIVAALLGRTLAERRG